MSPAESEFFREADYLIAEGFVKVWKDDHGEVRMRLKTPGEIQAEIEELCQPQN